MFISSLGVYFLISCLDIVNAATITRDVPSLTVPLRRRAAVSRRTNPEDFASMAQNLRNKYNYGTSKRSLDRRQGSGVVPVTDEQSDSSYSGQLSIGTPAQTFNVILDTGSSDLWLASTTCTQGCQGATTYNPSSSSSFSNQNQQVSITYGSGAVQGVLGTDSVTMGGFTTSQGFLVATEVSSGLVDGTLSGLLGLGFKSIANSGVTPLVQSLASGSSFSSPLMAFYLARFIDDQSSKSIETQGGTFTLGSTNSSLFTGDIDYVNIPSTVTPGFWLLPVTGISVGGSAVTVSSTSSGSSSSSSSQLAAIDTGTTLIGGPSDVVAAVYAKIPGSAQGTGQLQGYYTYPCSTKVAVSFTLGGTKSWPISSADFQLQAQSRDGSVVCLGAIFDLDGGSATPGGTPPSKRQSSSSTNPAWIIGDSFLKNVYSVFRYDPPSVGFAQLASNLPGATATPGAAVGGLSSGSSTPSTSVSSSTSTSVATFPPISPVTTAVRTSTSADVLPSPSSSTGNAASGLNVHAINLTWTFGLAGVIMAILRMW